MNNFNLNMQNKYRQIFGLDALAVIVSNTSNSSTSDTKVLSIDEFGNVHKLSFSSITTASSFTGGTVSGASIFTAGLSANTISATTYLNLPSAVLVDVILYLLGFTA